MKVLQETFKNGVNDLSLMSLFVVEIFSHSISCQKKKKTVSVVLDALQHKEKIIDVDHQHLVNQG